MEVGVEEEVGWVEERLPGLEVIWLSAQVFMYHSLVGGGVRDMFWKA
jgi:hypothetical protein